MILLGFAAAFIYGAICLLASVIFGKLGMPKKLTRKFVHVFVGFEWVILYVSFGPGWYSFAVCAAFTALLLFSYYYKLMPAISSDEDNAPGTVYYGVAMTLMSFVCIFVPTLFLPFGVAVICTSVGDGLAGVFGAYFGENTYKIIGRKSIVGFVSNFLSSFIFVLLFSYFFNSFLSVGDVLWISLLSAILEVVSVKGLDNLTVPLGICAFTYLLCNVTWIGGYVVPIVLTPLVAAYVLERGVLSARGVIAALIADAIVSVALGNFGFVALLLFLALGAGSDKVKIIKTGKEEKSARNEKQVMANSAVACLCALAYIYSPIPAFLAAFTVALAEALSDTVSSGIGALSKNTYDIIRMKKCSRGISGGVSLIGTLSGAASAFIIPFVALLFGNLGATDMLIVSLFAFLGCVLDSVLGSLAQVKYKCKKCGSVTDNLVHCGVEGNKYSGISGIDNSMVNFLSCAICAILTMIVFIN